MKIGKITENEVTITMTHTQGMIIGTGIRLIQMGEVVEKIQLSKKEIKPAEDIIAGIEDFEKRLKAKKKK